MAPRVIVVGSGIIGACIGLRLAQSGADVTIVEGEAPGAGTSGTSFAWLDASHPSLAGYVELQYRRAGCLAPAAATRWAVRGGCR